MPPLISRRLARVALLASSMAVCLACPSEGPTTPPPPPPPTTASVRVTATTTALMVGMQTTLTATPLDASGSVVGGRTVTWSTESQSVATVSAQGAVQAVGAGTTGIVATVDGKQGRAAVRVVARPECAEAALTLPVGEVRVLNGAQRSSVCVTGGTYSLVVLSADAVSSSRAQVEVTGAGLLSDGAPVVTALADRGFGLDGASQVPRRDLRAHIQSLESERVQMAVQPSPTALSASRGLMARAAPLSVGDTLSLYADPVPSNPSRCTQQPLVLGRVMAAGRHGLVVADAANPAGGYTADDYQRIALDFDTKVYPTDSAYFAPAYYHETWPGRPPVIIFFTKEVNRRTPAGSASSTLALVWSGDALFTASCPRSNGNLGYPEILYVQVPDPSGLVNGRVVTKANAQRGLIGTLAHELQHMINIEQRALNRADADEAWLNEGLSTVAEELLFYKLSGWSPKRGITAAMLQQNPTARDAFLNTVITQVDNLEGYLTAPESNTFYASSSPVATATYGAVWQFLRFAADRSSVPETRLWRDILMARTTGLRTLNATFRDSVQLRRDFAVAQVLSDSRLTMVPAAQRFLSWDFPNLYTSNPLRTKSVTAASPLSFSLGGGGTAYLQLDVIAGGIGAANVTSQSQPLASNIDLLLVRTR